MKRPINKVDSPFIGPTKTYYPDKSYHCIISLTVIFTSLLDIVGDVFMLHTTKIMLFNLSSISLSDCERSEVNAPS